MQKQMIELFSGSKTVSSVFQKNDWKTFTVDNNATLLPDLVADIEFIQFSQLPEKVHFGWYSPPCQTFSRAANQHHWLKQTNKYRQYTYFPLTPEAHKAIFLLQKTIEIINHFPDSLFIIENPIGRIQHMPAMRKLGHYRFAVNYADFGAGYSKETYLFSNVWLPFSTKKVSSKMPGLRTIHSRFQRSVVPRKLIETIFDYVFPHR